MMLMIPHEQFLPRLILQYVLWEVLFRLCFPHSISEGAELSHCPVTLCSSVEWSMELAILLDIAVKNSKIRDFWLRILAFLHRPNFHQDLAGWLDSHRRFESVKIAFASDFPRQRSCDRSLRSVEIFEPSPIACSVFREIGPSTDPLQN